MRNPSVDIGVFEREVLDMLEKLGMLEVHEWAATVGMGVETEYTVVINVK